MKKLPNLEKHPTEPRCYIAYDASGYAFRCMASKQQANVWYAVPSHADKLRDRRSFTAWTLTHLAQHIGASKRG